MKLGGKLFVEPATRGIYCQFQAACYFEFAVNYSEMVTDGFFSDEETFGNFLVDKSFSDQFYDFAFTNSQRIYLFLLCLVELTDFVRFVQKLGGQRAFNPGFALMNFFDCFKQCGSGLMFEKYSPRPAEHRTFVQFFVNYAR